MPGLRTSGAWWFGDGGSILVSPTAWCPTGAKGFWPMSGTSSTERNHEKSNQESEDHKTGKKTAKGPQRWPNPKRNFGWRGKSTPSTKPSQHGRRFKRKSGLQWLTDLFPGFGGVEDVQGFRAEDRACTCQSHGEVLLWPSTGKGQADPTPCLRALRPGHQTDPWGSGGHGEQDHPESPKIVNLLIFQIYVNRRI